MKVSRLLVPVAGHATDEEAIQIACSVARRHKARIYVIYVIEVKRNLPLDAELEPEQEKGEKVLDQAEQVASVLDSTIETELLQAREVGPAIVDEAIERGVDAIVLGLPYKRRFGEFTLGSTVNHVLKNAPCSVWVVRDTIANG